MKPYPFLSAAYLQALEESGAVSPARGWTPCHLRRGDAWLPVYERTDSRGEYVFDFAWADAYLRHGLNYYPKLVTAVPYTPVEGPRWRGQWSAERLWEEVTALLAARQASGWHLLFADRACRDQLRGLPLIEREACHFRWFNRGYRDFDDYLSVMISRKRKSVRRERRRVADAGIQIERRSGAEILPEHWSFFYRCYASTYLKRGQLPYLDERFFAAIAENLADQLMMVLAREGEKPVAAALYFYDEHHLYGRYWGCLREIDCLHFELCYYQGIDFAIEQGLNEFDPGVQGEHKLLRGFEPVITCSLHHLVQPDFHRAVAAFCDREAEQVRAYQRQAQSFLPFRAATGTPGGGNTGPS